MSVYGEQGGDTPATQRLNNAIDTEMNAVFGILVALWATFFVESWK